MILEFLKNQKLIFIQTYRLLQTLDIKELRKYTIILELPKRKTKKKPLSKEDKKNNQALAGKGVLNENIIGMIKRFRIISDRYRNRRKRFVLRFNLIAGIYNMEVE